MALAKNARHYLSPQGGKTLCGLALDKGTKAVRIDWPSKLITTFTEDGERRVWCPKCRKVKKEMRGD